MSANTRILDRWHDYSVADCACEYCLYYKGKKRGCSLGTCCCEVERAEAYKRERQEGKCNISSAAAQNGKEVNDARGNRRTGTGGEKS